MAPPTLSRLAKATGDARYLDFLDAEFKLTVDDLFDPTENFFYRDVRFLNRKSANGKKVFWGRGNGWVFGGIPLTLEAYPESRSTRKYYEELFRKMAPAVAAAQQPDGLWRPSLLDPEEIPAGETSGSGLFVYGLAWGVRHGLIEKDKYWPVVERGWNGLLTRIGEDGHVGYVQPVGSSPGKLTAESTQLYGTGAVLLAGAEILRSMEGAKAVDDAHLLRQAEQMVADRPSKAP